MIRTVWIVVDRREAFFGEERGSYKTARGAQNKYDQLKRCFPFGRFTIECVSVSDP